MSHSKDLFLDHAATTPLHPDALGMMLPFFGNHFGIPSSQASMSLKPRQALEEARANVAQLINADPSEIIFTSGATEANNIAILGSVTAKGSKGRHLITSQAEHASVLGVFRHLEREGFQVTYLPVDNQGRIDPSAVERAIRSDTLLISIMFASHAVGTIQPIEEIGVIAQSRGITFHTDAAQAAGKLAIDVSELPLDLLSISSHKLYGPKGAGALYVRDTAELSPVIFGQRQERGLRPGTENMPGIVGFGLACSIAARDLEPNAMLVTSLRESLEQQIITRIHGAHVHASDAGRLPHITCISFEDVDGPSLAAYLDALDITVSACSEPDPAHVLQAMGVPSDQSGEAIRLSIGWENKEREIHHTVECLEKAIARMRGFRASSEGKDLSIITFPDRESASKTLETLDNAGMAFTITCRPGDIMHTNCSSIALFCKASDQEEILSFLGEQGVGIAGAHKFSTRCRVMERKEQEFWKKVEQIKRTGK